LLGKISRAFWLQIGLITVAAIMGVYMAKILIEENLVKNAILGESEYFWKHYFGDMGIALPDTMNLTGYTDPQLLPPVIQDNLPSEPGFYEFSDLSNQLVLHISRQSDQTLYLVYYRGQVDALVLYYGLFPLLIVLTILYLTLWSVYRFSRRTISPFAQLANHINKIDLNKDDFSLNLTELEIPDDGEIKTLREAISRLGERLDSYITRERNFTRNASHELRTPLTVINVATDMMLIDAQSSEKSQRMLLKIKRAVYDMESLIELFLMLAREDSGSTTYARVDLNQLVIEQIERVEFLKTDKPVTINLTENAVIHVLTSETVLAVMLGNLIRNAVLYTDEGNIEITIDDRKISISDSGPGIPPAKLKRIFEPFDRADMDESVSGYGIGLTIVKRLCDRFGWQIQVASFAEQGTSFIITFDSTDEESQKGQMETAGTSSVESSQLEDPPGPTV